MRWRRRSTTDFSDEIREHIAHETDRLIAEGLPPDEAAIAARRAFGNVTTTTERFHESQRIGWVDRLQQDLRTALRSVMRYPVVAVVAVLSLGAGIGATAASLTVRDVLFENPPPLYGQPEQLSKVQVNRRDRPIRPLGSDVRGDLYLTWSRELGESMAAASAGPGPTDVRTGDRVEPAPVRGVTANLFSLLGVAPDVGRSFSTGKSGQSAPPEAILSHRLWQEWFTGRSDVIGATIWINDQPHAIVGVMPRRFWFSELNDPIWTRLDAASITADTSLQVVVRRPAALSATALASRLETSMTAFARRLPAGEGPLHLRVSPVKGTPLALQMAAILPFLLGASVLLTLLIACANVAILMTAQWTRREAETAVRSALGASRWRLTRALLTESILLSACAGALGIAVTLALQGIMRRNAPMASTFFDLSVHSGVLIKTAVITLTAGVLAGLGPALFETRRLQLDPLRGIATSDRIRQRWSHALVVLEITLTLALLVVTTSMIGGYQRSKDADLGFDPAPLMIASVANRVGIQIAPLVEQLGRVPGVRAVAAATAMPLGGVGRRVSASTNRAGANAVRSEEFSIDPAFFSTLGVTVRAGRQFTSSDTARTGAAIVNETLAVQLFGQTSPIGRQVWVGESALDVIGVVSDYKGNPIERRTNTPMVFVPFSTDPKAITAVRFLIRGDGDPSSLVQPVRRTLRDSAVGLVFTGGYTMNSIRTVQGQEMLLGTAPLFPLIVIGMLLTSSGIYGVLAFAVSRRARELAVRVAIGADRGKQVRLVVSRSLRLLTAGSICGVALTFGLSRLVRAAGGAGTIYDPPWPAFVLPVVLVFVVGMVATWIPTQRALRIDPALLLKTN